jgi:hypothetical protein
VIEPRIYRAAFLPALFALVLVAFSLESPPRALEQGPAADVLFEGSAARERVRSIVDAQPDRAAGTTGNRETAERVQEVFEQSGFQTEVDRFDAEDRSLVNVVGTRAGDSTRRVVVLAARDSDSVPDATGSAADTAALMEFARVFEGRALGRTLVLASVDGGQVGDAGARRFSEELGDPENVDAVIVMSDLGARTSRGPLVVGWSNGTTRAGLPLQRTFAESLRQEIEAVPRAEGTLAQFARLAFPVAPGSQGVVLDAGFDSVRLAAAGETGDAGGEQMDDLDVERYGALGRAVLRMIGTLESSERDLERGERTYLTLGGMQLPGWVLLLLAVTLVLPALVTSIDALARARRRREPVSPWLVWIAASVLPFLVAVVLVWLMSLVGLIEDAPSAPLHPRSVELDGAAIGAIVAATLTAALGWILARTRVVRRRNLPDPTAPGAACAASLALSLLALVVAVTNPFAALLLVPALHLWMLATLTEVPARASFVMGFLGLVPLLAAAAYLMVHFQLGPPRALWYLLLLVTGNQTGILTTLAGCVLLGIIASVGLILLARARAGLGDRGRGRGDRRPDEPPRPPIFGPGGHAGPGMLGGTTGSSARR